MRATTRPQPPNDEIQRPEKAMMKDPAFRREYDALEDEFALMPKS